MRRRPRWRRVAGRGRKNRMDTPAIEKRIRTFFENTQDQVAAVYLFGSVVSGRARSDSDVDVGVLLSSRPAATFDGLGLGMEDDLTKWLGREVDLALLNDAPPDLAIRVLRGGKLLLEYDRSARIRFEVRTRNEYFDLEPYLLEYRGSSS